MNNTGEVTGNDRAPQCERCRQVPMQQLVLSPGGRAGRPIESDNVRLCIDDIDAPLIGPSDRLLQKSRSTSAGCRW